MGLFSTAQQSIPVRFQEKVRVDSDIDDLLKDKVVNIRDIPEIKKKLEPLREEQQALRISCEAFITEKKARGPMAT